ATPREAGWPLHSPRSNPNPNPIRGTQHCAYPAQVQLPAHCPGIPLHSGVLGSRAAPCPPQGASPAQPGAAAPQAWRQQEAPRRVKRAWVIPPISVSENHKRIPHLLVQIKSDKQQPGGVIYSIKGPGVDEEPLGIFSIDKFSGKVFLNAMLDREENDRYRLRAFALDLGGVTLEDPTDLEIIVVDQGARTPPLCQHPLGAPAATGTCVMTVDATDADDPDTDNAALRYSILEQGAAAMFSINATTGEICTARPGLDRETMGVYNLTVQAADMSGDGLTTTAMAVIYLEDINDNPPEFTKEEVAAGWGDGTCLDGVLAAATAGAGITLGALMIILGSTILLLVLAGLGAARGRSRRRALRKGLLQRSRDDMRDNILNYDEQGGGEEDQDAYDINQLRHPELFSPRAKPPLRRDAPLRSGTPLAPRKLPSSPSDIEDFINEGLEAADSDPSVPPYDTALIYDYEGSGSVASPLSSIVSSLTDEDQDYDYLSEWGPRFRRLADLYGH
ncbi:PREDICTED: cadherin-15, partial [Corvus brachyrhynchos]|uniref:cadherin-15 n=1 Tax=Corvus brachyrhynchos TaxID=85066 RepID=UPI0008164E03